MIDIRSKMLLFLVSWPVFLTVAAQTLTIDTQLGTSVEDCFERTSLGERLPPDAIYRNISELTARECERICKQDKQCQSFDYGVGAKGNATCNLSSVSESDIKTGNVLQKHPDYDVYIRRFNCEQSPPSPIFNDDFKVPNRPVIRPGQFEDSKAPPRPDHIQRPLHDEPVKDRPIIERPVEQKPYDLKPYESNWPQRPYPNYIPYGKPPKNYYDYYDKPRPHYDKYRPEYSRPQRPHDRPGYNNVLDYERPDDYGSIKPEFDRPVGYGSHIAQDIPYKPRPTYSRPIYNQTYEPYKPGSNDILHFQHHYNWNRPRPESYRPDPYYSPKPDDEVNDIYGPRPSKPYKKPAQFVGDDYYKPADERPVYDYIVRPTKKPYQNSEPSHNSGYGHRPDPIEPHRPEYDSLGYGSGPIGPPTEKPYVQNRPYERPTERPIYPRPSSHYDINYRPSYNKPNDLRPSNKPNYNEYSGYGSSYGSNSQSFNYGSLNYGSQSQYGPSQSGYGSQSDHGSQSSYGSQSSGYGSPSSTSYGTSQSGYNSQNNYEGSSSYDSQSSGYGSQHSDHFSQINGYGSQNNDLGSQNSGYGSQSSGYGSQSSGYGSQSSGYGSQSSGHASQSSDYGSQNAYGSQSQSSYGSSNDNKIPTTQISQTVNYVSTTPQKPSSSKPEGIRPVYEYEIEKPEGEKPSYVQRPGGQVVSSKPVAVGGVAFDSPGYGGTQTTNYNACYRRVLAGRRALRSNVRRVLPCERLEDCQRECAEERRFHCESFNYKLDTTFRGKGLCELMTKPIEDFDIRRDFVEDREYDFYELDRNSLQPECIHSWHGPSYAHSGFLGGSHDWRPGYDEVGYRRNYNRRHSNRNSYRNYENKGRWDDQFYVPYQIGIGRSNDEDFEHTGSYGHYYNDKNDYRNSLNYWGLDHDDVIKPDIYYGVRPHGSNVNDFNYHSLGNRRYNSNVWDSYSYGYGHRKQGHWSTPEYSHGSSGLVYGESNYYGPNHLHGDNHIYLDHHKIEEKHYGSKFGYDCSSRRRFGMSLGSGVIRRSLIAHTVLDCESACFRETAFRCVSYSYRYSKSHGSENCFLSETPYRGLDLTSDSGSDVYSMGDHKYCGVSAKPWIESECFLHIRSGKAISGDAIQAALSVVGLGACEAECIRARGFFCRGFSFRFDPPTIGEEVENCLLSSSPPSGIRGPHQLRTAPGHELYARGNYGRGCEPDIPEDSPAIGDTKCYLQYDNAARLLNSAARGRARVRDEAECSKACTDAPFRCLSFSYSSSALSSEENCLLSEIKLFDLQLGVDYEHSTHDWLFAFDLFNKGCWRKVLPGYDDDRSVNELPRPLLPPPIHESSLPPSGHSGHPGGPGYPAVPAYPGGPGYSGSPGYPSGPGYLPGVPDVGSPSAPSGGFRPSGYLPEPPIISGASGPGYKPGYLPEPPAPSEYPTSPGRPGRPGYLPGDKGIDFEEQFPITWRHYTVSGFPCRRGTTCAQNVVAGHWSCEPEGGEIGSWDYCCAPTHRCGYSEGFHKPWCYVGESRDQWRPCSEKYYPYHQHNVPHPSQGHREERPRPVPGRPGHVVTGDYQRPWRPGSRPSGPDSYLPIEENRPHRPDFLPSPYLSEADRRYWDDLYKNGPQAYYDSHGNPLPGYTRLPTADRPHIKYHHSYGPTHGSDRWSQIASEEEEYLDPPVPGGFGVPRYWPVAYLHKGPPPNTTYFNYKDKTTSSTERYNVREKAPINPPKQSPSFDFERKTTELPRLINNNIDNPRNRHRDEKNRNLTKVEDELIFKDNLTEITTSKIFVEPKDTKEKVVIPNTSVVESRNTDEEIDDIDDKLEDLSAPIEVLNIEDAKNQKGEKSSEIKTLEAEERQIEEIGRLLATRRGGKFVLEKRSQSDLESQNIKITRGLEEDIDQFNFGSKFVPVSSSKVERRGIVQKVPKGFVDAVVAIAQKPGQHDHSLEVSETSYARSPSERKAYVNGQVFYDATIKDKEKTERKPKFIKVPTIEEKTEASTTLQSFGQRTTNPKNISTVRKGRRYYRRRYNPEEVRKRLLERGKNKDVK